MTQNIDSVEGGRGERGPQSGPECRLHRNHQPTVPFRRAPREAARESGKGEGPGPRQGWAQGIFQSCWDSLTDRLGDRAAPTDKHKDEGRPLWVPRVQT